MSYALTIPALRRRLPVLTRVGGSFYIAAALGACASLTAANVTQEISDVQVITKDLCAVIPTATAIGSIISAGNPALTTAAAIANAVCAAVGTPPASARFHSVRRAAAFGVAAGSPAKVWTPAPVVISGVTVSFE